jgi:hypothetical protein
MIRQELVKPEPDALVVAHATSRLKTQLLTFLFWRWLDGFVGRLTEGRDRLTQQP